MEINEQELFKKYFPQALEETKNLIKIRSFKTAAEPGAPYGIETKKVLDYMIQLGQKLGFKTYQDSQNRYGFFDYDEEQGKELFVILCHLDVVPPGNLQEWITDPFHPLIKDDKLIGRGAFDDKGPTMMNLYALKYLKDHGFKSDQYQIRIIFGLTEETTWESIHAYLKDFGQAKMGYVPDAEFPVVYAEKWVVNLDFESNQETDFEILGGAAYNVVNDYVTYKGPKIAEIAQDLATQKIITEQNNGQLIIKGKAGHGSLPWLGVNAATFLAQAMINVGFKNQFLKFMVDHLHQNFNCHKLFGKIKDETGDLTQNLGIIEVKNGHQRLAMNYRVPVFSQPQEKFLPLIKKAAQEYGLQTKLVKIEDAVYVPKDSMMVEKIMKVYQEVTGDQKSQPLAIGGGTYAKAMPGLVAFGAEFKIEESTMHAYNEFVKIADLKKMLEIYTKAIVLLTK